MDKNRLLSSLAFGASFFAWGVIALGAVTRLIDAGLGCPDWPGCYGNLTVPLSALSQQLINAQYPTTPLTVYKAWAEMIHRYFVGGLSLFILVILAFIFTQKKLRQRGNIILGISIFALLIYQILLGRWTVTLKLLPIVVTQHLIGGFLILATLWIIYLNNATTVTHHSAQKIPRFFSIGALIGTIILLLQIFLGAWTSTNYASLSCPGFPFCHNDTVMIWHFKEAFNFFSPIGMNYEGGVLSEGARQTIQILHRLGAIIVTLYTLFFVMLISRKQFDVTMQKWVYSMLLLLCIQLCLGIANVIFQLPLATALAHNLTASLLLISFITVTFKLFQSQRSLA